LQFLARLGAVLDQARGVGQFDIGGVLGIRVVDDEVLAGVGNDLEFMAARASDGAGVRRHGAEFQAQALKDAGVGGIHGVVAGLRAGLIAVEGISVLHGEFASAHQAEARAALVAELGLDVIEIARQLAPAVDFVAHDVGNDFFGRGLQHEVAAVPVLDAQQLGAVLLPAARLHP